MIIDTNEEFDSLIDYVSISKHVLIIPLFTDPTVHPSIDKLCCIYICADEIERVIPIYHTEQIRGFSERLQDVLTLSGVYTYDLKDWHIIGGNGAVFDLKSLWRYTYNEAYIESHYYTEAHKFYWNIHTNLKHINSIIPLMSHIRMFQKIKKYAWPMIVNSKLTESYKKFNSTYPLVFANIEKSGLRVKDTFPGVGRTDDNMVYSRYNYFTLTGRPSNTFNNFNFAAMNKSDGTRSHFISRHGALVEFDFDAYHLRLIANELISYNLPIANIHAYLGSYYYGKSYDDITNEQYDESKQVSFRQIYGGIEPEFLNIPFFAKINEFISEFWDRCKSRQSIITKYMKYTIPFSQIENITPNKAFNYYLQALETEVSVLKLYDIIQYINTFKSKLVLYTYDSILLDIHKGEFQVLLPKIKGILEQNGYPVKIKVGMDYNNMKLI